ncbi:MAG: porin [Verrucomicrobia bacterium]|nr:porin [Verrucomicrobiota bacterium]
MTESNWLDAVRARVNSLRFGVVQIVAGVAAVAPLFLAPSAAAAEPAPTTEQLLKRIDELEQKVKVLDRNRELEANERETKARTSPQITVGERGFGFASADGNFALKFRGVVQIDSRTFLNDHGIAGNDGILVRRARPIVEGTVFRDFDFLFVPDFGGSTPQIFDAYLNYRVRPELQLRVGKFKSPVGLEQLVVDVDTLFNERALPTSLTPNRDLGVQLHGEVFDGRLNYAVGIFNGTGDARNISTSDFDDDKEFAGRIFLQPFKKSSVSLLQGIGFGVGGSYGSEHTTSALPATTGGTLAGYATDGQQQYFAYNPSTGVVTADGEHWRLSPQGYYYHGPFGLLGEYVISNQRVSRTGAAPLTSARLENTGWQITGSWILTGETAAYKGGVNPEKPFSVSEGGWGAWQLIARYAELNVDANAFPNFANPATSASGAHAWSVGLNWFLNRNITVKTSFSHTTFDFASGGGSGTGTATTAPGIVARQPENVLFTRVQLAF